ncbi:MAG: hypothetical protein IJE12_04270 [Prevotella sp.]|nr:hypothetical protein [Prevotella sp.]
MKKLKLLLTACAIAFGGLSQAFAADWSAATLEAGKHYFLNVGANKWWGAGNSWGTQASLLPNPEYLTLIVDGSNYKIESQVSNGGTQYYFNGSYMDNGSPVSLTIETDGTNYSIANGTTYYGYDGSTTVLGTSGSRDTDNFKWQIYSEAQMLEMLNAATSENPVDATFLILNQGFGRNNRNSSAWTMVADDQNMSGGNNINNCAESYHSTFTLTQTLSNVPNGLYTLTAQGFHNASDNTDLPYFYINDETCTFPAKTGSEGTMTDASVSFTNGLYTIDPIKVTVTDGTIKVGAKNETRTDLWCIFDNFVLKFYGDPIKALQQLLKESANNAIAEINAMDIPEAAKTACLEIIYANDNSEGTFTEESQFTEATSNIDGALKKANIYKGVNEYLTKMKAILDNTNVYTAASYKTYYQDIKGRYDSSTLDETADAVYTANSAYSTGWHSANYIDDILLSTWTISGESASNYDKKLYINTWSIEGNTDGSEFLAPFFEYWVADASVLAANTIVSTITGLEANTNYSFTIRARVRETNEKTKITNGITMKVGEGEAVDISAGAQFNAGQYYIGNFSAMGETDAEGNLTVTITVAENSNISWLSFYNCKYSEGEDLSAYIADYEFALNNLKAIEGKPVDPNYVSEISEAITEYSTVDNTNKEALIAAKEAIDAVLEKVNPSIAALAGSAIKSWTTTTNNGEFKVNTWSTEGNSDGSGMTTPFMQNWIASGTVLNDATMSYTLENQKAGYYKVTGLVRVLDESKTATPAGVFLSANDAIERAYGANAMDCTNGVYGNPVVYGLVGDDGKLTISIKIINTNVNWISWKNLSVEYIGESLTQEIADNLTEEARVFANDPVAKATQANAIEALSTLSDANYIAAAKAIEAAYKAEDRDVVDYSQLQTAFDNFEVKENLGFEEGEYAPYTNATLLKAYADAAAMLEDETAITQEEANDLASTLSNLTWVANTEEVNAVANGDFSNTPSASADFYKTGWVRTNGWGQIRSDATLASAGYAYYNQGGSLTYGNSELPGYTMPLKANTVYQLSFKYAQWDKETTITASVLNANNEGLSARSYTPNAKYNVEFPTATVLFKTGEAGNYVLTLAGTQNYVVTDVVIKKAVAEDLTINEDEKYTPAEKYANVTFNRTLVEGWNGLVLPFDMTIDDFKNTFSATAVKAFSGITEGADFVTLSFEDATEIKAGVPVMVKAAAGTEYTINNVFVPATGLQTVAKEDGNAKFVFTGTYAPTTLTDVSFVLINGTKYYYHEAGTTATSAKAFRGYFVDESTEASAAKSVIFDFNEATGIENVNAAINNADNGAVYDLQGRRVVKPSKGIYVANGKKVVIK